MMPKMSGAETFAKLKEMPGFITPVVALTANAISGMRENYLELGFDEYLAKPIEKEALIKVLNKVLDEKEETVTNVTVVENEKIEKDEQSHEEYLRSNGVNLDKALELLGDMNMYEVRKKYGQVKRWSKKTINELAFDLGVDKGANDFCVGKEAHYNRELETFEPTGRWFLMYKESSGVYITNTFSSLDDIAKYLINNFARK